MKSYAELLADAKRSVKEIGVRDLMALRHTTGDVVIVAGREDAWQQDDGAAHAQHSEKSPPRRRAP